MYKTDIRSTQNDTLSIVNLFIPLRYSLMHLSPLKKRTSCLLFSETKVLDLKTQDLQHIIKNQHLT